MNLTDEELTKLEETKGSPEWNNIVDEIKQIRQGDYPPDWGECQNSKVQSAIRLSLKLVDLGKPELDEVTTYARIHFDEDVFGCILFEAE